MRVDVKGLGSGTKILADGTVRYYLRAWRGRGAPVIAEGDGRTLDEARTAALAVLALPATLARLNELRGEHEAPKLVSVRFVEGLSHRYIAALEASDASPGHKKAVRRFVEDFADCHGDWRVALFERPETIRDIVAWRERYADRPRTADYAMSAVSAMFTWARRQGYTLANPTADVQPVHTSNRADLTWTAEDLERAKAAASPAFFRLMRLAALTGLRQGDLIRLTWSAIGERSIAWRTSKRGKLAAIPLLPETRTLLAEFPRVSPVVAANTDGRPWTRAGVASAMRRLHRAAPELAHLHFHDLRGTACTAFRAAGLRAGEIALVMGWSERQVEERLALYANADDLVEGILTRLEGAERERKLQTGVQTGPAPAPTTPEKSSQNK